MKYHSAPFQFIFVTETLPIFCFCSVLTRKTTVEPREAEKWSYYEGRLLRARTGLLIPVYVQLWLTFVWSLLQMCDLTFCWRMRLRWSSHSWSLGLSEWASVPCKHDSKYRHFNARMETERYTRWIPSVNPRNLSALYVDKMYKMSSGSDHRYVWYLMFLERPCHCIGLCESPAWRQNYCITPARTLKKLSGESVARYASIRLHATHV